MNQLTEQELATLRVMLKTKIKRARVWDDIQRYKAILSKLTPN